ncbi:DUF397 domain-containing protein [Micromonospora sp. NPDC049679]|uniref:DUF397 domain-containing protein n=1 Tax=Micromonospora sp. NPDC049679 TaxID=3155920 RepID=UPI0033F3798E
MEGLDTARAAWRESTRSNANGACVEVAELAGGVGVRDSKNVTGGLLVLAPSRWRAFIAGVKHGTFTT